MESQRKFILIQDMLYILLGMYGGRVYLGKPTDVNNEIVLSGIIWKIQPFEFHKKTKRIKILYYRIIRFFKQNCFGHSDFKTIFTKITNFN